MPEANSWYVITGGPSTGKSTLIEQLARRGFKTVPEAARLYIDESLERGISVAELRADEQAFQDEVMRRKIALEAALDPHETIFLDRGMQDTLAYLRANDFPAAPGVEKAMRTARYRAVFLLEPLEWFTHDYARTEDAAFTARLHELLKQAYQESGMETIPVPPVSPRERVTFILEHMKTESAA